MKTKLTVVLCASVLAIAACSSDSTGVKVGSRDDIIVKNRGDVSTVAMSEPMIAPMPEADLVAPVESVEMSAEEATTEMVETTEEMVQEEVTPVVVETDEMIQETVETPVPETAEVITEANEAIVEAVQETVPEAVNAVEEVAVETVEVVEETAKCCGLPEAQEPVAAPVQTFDDVVEEAARVSPYVPTY